MWKDLNHSVSVNSNTSSPMNVTDEYILVVDFPSKSFLSDWEKIGPCSLLDESTNYFIAFDSSGKVAGPCHLLSTDLASCVSVVPASP